MKSKSTFCIRFDGKNEINALLLSKAISDMSELMQIAVKEENLEANAELNVTALKSGSFQINFSTIAEALPTLLTSVAVVSVIALNAVKTIEGGFKIKKHLGNKKPKSIEDCEDENTVIENDAGEKITVPKTSFVFVNNVKGDQFITNIANYAREHNPEGSFTFFNRIRRIYFFNRRP